MATLKQRLHRKNASGSYDTIHLETSSSLVLRPSGRTVEQDLEAYLPKVQDSDTVPESLIHHKLLWIENIFKGGRVYLWQLSSRDSIVRTALVATM